MAYMIEVSNLVKVYQGSMFSPQAVKDDLEKNAALKGISFTVDRGQILGFLGPNGAGKTTTMKILTSYMSPTSGRIKIAGYDIFENSLETRKRIGYLPENAPLYHEMNVWEFLTYIAEIRQIKPKNRQEKLHEISEICGLKTVLGKDISELSKGFRQRVGLAQAMVHNPDIIILDEPTSGLDPNQIREIREMIKKIGQEKTVILSTHNLGEVQATCERVLIIKEGRLVADDLVANLQTKIHGNPCYKIKFKLKSGKSPEAVNDQLKKVLNILDAKILGKENGEIHEFMIESSKEVDIREALFNFAVTNQFPIMELKREEATLEEIFSDLTRD